MRICLFSRAPFIGGAEVACERLALGLLHRGHQVSMIVDQQNEVFDRFVSLNLDCRVFRLPFRGKKQALPYLFHWLRLRQFLKSFAPDIVHSNDLPTHQFVSSVAGHLRIPRVCHHRFIYDGTCIDWLNRRKAEIHIFISRYLRDLLFANSGKLAQESSHLVYDGLPLLDRVTNSDRIIARRSLGLPKDPKIVLFAGQIIQRKGVRDLLDAWRMLEPRGHNGQLFLVGEDLENNGAYRREMENYANSRGIHANFAGFQSNIAEWLRAADVAVVPSHNEPLGLANLEAMMAGLPVIGTYSGGIPEIVLHGETGLLIPVNSPNELADAIFRLLSDPTYSKNLGEAGRKRCEEIFSLDEHVQRMIDIYSELMPIRR